MRTQYAVKRRPANQKKVVFAEKPRSYWGVLDEAQGAGMRGGFAERGDAQFGQDIRHVERYASILCKLFARADTVKVVCKIHS